MYVCECVIILDLIYFYYVVVYIQDKTTMLGGGFVFLTLEMIISRGEILILICYLLLAFFCLPF